MRLSVFYFFFFILNNVQSQTIFEEDFNQLSVSGNWLLSPKVESAVWLGKNNSNYIRFHPNFQNQSIVTPNIATTVGNYTLFFEWNKARIQTPDSVQIQLSANNGNTWQTIYSIYDGNNRTWQKDSVELNNINGSIKIRWNYFSSGSFPSQYFNLDNVSIVNNISTNIKNKANYIDFSIFPNPANNAFQLQLRNPMLKHGTLTIFNALGEIVLRKNLTPVMQTLHQIDVTNFIKGAYIIQLQFDEEQFSKTILVQ